MKARIVAEIDSDLDVIELSRLGLRNITIIEDTTYSISNILTAINNPLIHKSTRQRDVVADRQIAHYIAKNNTDLSLAEIGKRIGNKNYATVLHSVKLVEGLLYSGDKLFRKRFDEINKNLKAIIS